MGGANKGALNNGARDKSSGGARVGVTKREDDEGIEAHQVRLSTSYLSSLSVYVQRYT